MRYLRTLLFLFACAVGCQGPISDWPHSKGDDNQAPSAGAGGSIAGANPSPSTNPPVVTGTGGTTSGATNTPGGIAAGMGGTTGAPPATTLGGNGSADAGASIPSGSNGGVTTPPADSGSANDAGVSFDAGAPTDGGPSDSGQPDGGQPDAAPPANDAGCVAPSSADGGLCPGYGCRTSIQQLRTSMDGEGACSSERALSLACDGRVSNAALQCTQDSAFSLNIGRAVSSCLKRDPQLAMLGDDCLECFVDESLCTLARCFAACTANGSSACQTCKHQQCSANLALCTGLPAP